MTKKRHTPEQIVTLLRQVEVAVGNRKSAPQACKEAVIIEALRGFAGRVLTDQSAALFGDLPAEFSIRGRRDGV